MNDPIQDLDSKVTARRRLIRGVFATPAVYTLCSGRALAQTTSRLRCINNANINPVDPVPPVDMDNETYLRVQLVTANPTDNKAYVRGDRLPAPRHVNLPTNAQWQEFDITNNTLVGAPAAVGPSTDLHQYAVIRINADGLVVDVGNSSGVAGSAIGHSCWTSFIAP